MQLLLPSKVSFQVTPSDVNFDSLVRKMYQPKRTLMYPQSPYARGVSGFGACDPMDVACVEAQEALSAARQQQQQEQSASSNRDQCIANGTDPAVCDARWPSGYAGNVPFLNLTPDQQAAQMATPLQAAAQVLATPNVAQELHDFSLNPAALLPSNVPVLDQYTTPAGVVVRTSSASTPYGYSPASSSPANPAKPNQSVPPTTPLIPMQTGFQNTAAAILQQQAAGQAGKIPDSTLTPCQFWESPSTKTPGQCDTNTMLVFGGLAAVGLLLFMRGKK